MLTLKRLFIAFFCSMFFLCLISLPSAADGPPPAKVRVGPVVEEEVAQTRVVLGVLYYDRVSEISTELAGLVDKIQIKQGDRVQAGAPLVYLNTEILDKEIALQKARIEQIGLRIANAKKNYLRLQRLFEQSGVSEKEYDDALFTFQDAEKEKQATESILQMIKKNSVQ